jgi:CDP-diglyceride synthetase
MANGARARQSFPFWQRVGCAFAFQAQAWGVVLGCLGIGAGLYSLLQRKHPLRGAVQTALMLAYLALPSGIVLWVRTLPDGHWWVLCLFLSSFMGTDVAAYVGGRYFGKRPIFPAFLPAKRWRGC